MDFALLVLRRGWWTMCWDAHEAVRKIAGVFMHLQCMGYTLGTKQCVGDPQNCRLLDGPYEKTLDRATQTLPFLLHRAPIKTSRANGHPTITNSISHDVHNTYLRAWDTHWGQSSAWATRRIVGYWMDHTKKRWIAPLKPCLSCYIERQSRLREPMGIRQLRTRFHMT
ncbi:hypothetical protein SCLCIDRAFT_623048 [Scleroderma citrinum Foug A]|uniref:Uncharacterized protein n=1 Tax=Scleroderma citrinum Foug A TaxID=1036808 RepID=A0A0C3D5D5_9AGAM|nr:hypothetical protein SCLCIDRAFT_623048 [Scleroderma citrinum Foug A]